MTLEILTSIINKISFITERSAKLKNEFNIDLFDYEEEYYSLYSILLDEIFTEEGKDWVEWYIYELPSLKERNPEQKYHAWDSNNNPILLDNIPSLFNFLKENKYF